MVNSSNSVVSQMVFIDPRRVVALMGIRSGMKVAEFGVGRGYYALELARLVGPEGIITGVDIMPNALEALNASAQAQGFTTIRTIQANLEVLGGTGISDGSQDLVLVANILFQSDKKRDMIAEALRTLKPEGALCVIDWLKNAGGLGPPDEVRSDEAVIRAMVEELGFQFSRNIETDSYHFGMIFQKLK